jgi:hypothetical protein
MFKNKKQKQDTKRQARIPEKQAIVYSNFHSRTRSGADLQYQKTVPATNSKSDKAKNEKTSKSLLYRLPSLLVIGLIAVSVGYLLTLDAQPTVLVRDDEDLLFRLTQDYELAAAREVNSNVIKKFKPFFSSKKFSESFLEQHSEIKSIDVRVPVVDRSLVVILTPESPALLVNDSLNQYLVAKSGKVIAPIKDFDSSKFSSLPVVEDKVLETIDPGQYILSQSTLEFIEEVLYQLRVKSIGVERVSLPAIASELHIQVDRGYIVKFNLQEDPSSQAGSYLALLEHFDRSGDVANEYVDVRVGEKVFFR